MTLSRDVLAHTALSRQDIEWLDAFVHEWHLLADTSFSDLICWVPDVDDNVFWAAAQVRPNTGPTALEDDVIGWEIRYDVEHPVTAAYLSHEISETSEGQLDAGIPVDVWAIPVIQHGRCVAIVERHTNQMGVRAPGSLEDSYLEVADTLTNMLWHGIFPIETPSDPALSPHVGDGLVTVAPDGIITYASPNSLSGYRRLGYTGDLEGEAIEVILAQLRGTAVDEVGQEFIGDLERRGVVEFEVSNGQASIRVRAIPLSRDDIPFGLLVLTRDTTQLRAAEQQLVTKNATIREIHHRVKNNLQTVAALLRLQSRRVQAPEAKAALAEAMGRVSAIALVHETLSQSLDGDVDFDEIADRVISMVAEMAARSGTVRGRRRGSFGQLPANVATSLSLVITELAQNAIEHGLGWGDGEFEVAPERHGNSLGFAVLVAGRSLPTDFEMRRPSSLGLSIVTNLVTDLGGTFQLTNRADCSGTRAQVEIPLLR